MSSPMTQPDPGRQPERTTLAWRRTVLAVGIGALLSIRLLPAQLGLGSLMIGGAGFGAAALVWVLAGHRGLDIRRGLRVGNLDLPDGRLPLLLAVLVSGGAVVGLAVVLTI